MNEYQLANVTNSTLYAKPMDIDYDNNGKCILLDGVKVIDQMIIKALLTNLGSNQIRPLYGGSFGSLIGTKLDQASSAIFMVSETERVVNRIAQFTQSNLNLTPDQRIVALEDILLDTDSDPRKVVITILIRTESGNSRALQVPIENF